jgi:hypothetical protein
METLQLIAILASALAVSVLLALLVNLFRAMTRFTLALAVVLAFAALCAVMLSFVTWPETPSPSVEMVTPDGDVLPEQPPTVPNKVGTSAAVAVRRFLVGLIVVGVLGTVGAVVGRHLWQERQERARLQDALDQAQVYALMSGERLPQGLPRRLTQGGGNVIVVGGQEAPTQARPQPQPWEVVQ